MEQEQSFDLRELAWRLRRYGWLLVLPLVACLCAAAVYYAYSTPIYVAQVGVSVEGSEKALPEEVDPLVGAVMQRSGSRERVGVVDGKVHSRAFLRSLAERLGMNTRPDIVLVANEAVKRARGITAQEYAMLISIRRLGDMITVSTGRGSLIQIAARGGDPQAARNLADMIGDLLVEESRQSTAVRTQETGEFRNDQIALAEERVRKAEEAYRNFQEATLSRGFSVGIVTAQNLPTARDLVRSTNDAVEQLNVRIQGAKRDWRTTMGSVAIPELKSPYVTNAIDQMSSLETSYAIATLNARPDDHTETDALQGRIAATRKGLYEEFQHLSRMLPGDFSPDAQAAAAGIALDQALLQSLEARRDRLATEINTYVKSIERSPSEELQTQRLRQEVETSRNLLASLRQQVTSSQVSQALVNSELAPRLEVVERALLPLVPSWPLPRRVFGVAALLGILISTGIVFAGERLAVVLRTTEQTEAEFGRRVIGTVSRIDGWSRPGTYLGNHWAPLAVILVLLVTGIAFAFRTAVKGHHPTTDQSVGLQQ